MERKADKLGTTLYHKTFQINNTYLFTHKDYAKSGRSSVRIPAGVWGFLQNVQNVSGAHPTSYSMVPGFFPAGKAARE
jgi:hypothetical protein